MDEKELREKIANEIYNDLKIISKLCMFGT